MFLHMFLDIIMVIIHSKYFYCNFYSMLQNIYLYRDDNEDNGEIIDSTDKLEPVRKKSKRTRNDELSEDSIAKHIG